MSEDPKKAIDKFAKAGEDRHRSTLYCPDFCGELLELLLLRVVQEKVLCR